MSVTRVAYEFGASFAEGFVYAVPLVVAAAALSQVWEVRRSRDWLEVTAAGIRPSRFLSVLIPPHAVASIEVRIWPYGGRGSDVDEREACLSVRLTDGRIAQVPGLQRTMRKPKRRWGLDADVDGRGWVALSNSDGTPLSWTLLTDEDVLSELSRQITTVLGGFADAQTAPLAAQVALQELEHWDPPDRSFQEGNVSVLATKAKPPSWMNRAPGAPRWEPPRPSAFYWSRASARTSRGPLRRCGLRFENYDLQLVGRWRTESISYSEIDRFDVVLRENNVWELSLILRDGTFRDLPGLRHGLWATSPLLLNNELRWRDSAGAGSLPWGSDATLLATRRLNAQLAGSRG